MYKALIRPLLFLLSPERAHRFTFQVLHLACLIPGVKEILRGRYGFSHKSLERNLLGLTFPNPVGLAAGFDKDAKHIDELACLGFGFIEIGTLTPKAQPGNEKPRLFRLPADKALINRMGFNNGGVEAAATHLSKRRSKIIVGGNIGRNKLTQNESADEDYVACLEALFPFVDYFVVNVSSPNTPGLRALQEKEPLRQLMQRTRSISRSKDKPKPVLLKIAPDLTNEQLQDVVEIVKATGTDGIIATNTTISRDGLTTSTSAVQAMGAGGLSGKPLRDRSTEVIRFMRKQLGPGYPIIGVGGIMSADDAAEKLAAGADLVQVYTGFVYEGPGFVKRVLRGLAKK